MTRPPRRPGKDRLVDWRLMAQTYGFIGVLETISSFSMSYWYLERQGIPFSALWFQYGALPADLDPNFVAAKLNEASSIYFVNLVVMQWFNLMAIRTRRLSIFQHPPLFNKNTQNLSLFGGILFALVFVFFWLYIPAFQRVFGTTSVPVQHFFLPMTFGLGVLFLDEARKYAVRRWPTGFFAMIAW
jgi:sodium/potassium-transporting ATPase subunit alpha